MTFEEKYVDIHRMILSESCCDNYHDDKIEIYKLGNVGYRIFCNACCAIADGTTVEQAVDRFLAKKFYIQPKYY